MKTNFKYVMLMAAALVLGLSSCSNDDDATGNSPEEGTKTYVSINFTSPTTYGTSQAGTAAESKINSVDVFIYNTAGILKHHEQLTGFSESSGVWKTSTLVETTTGAKQIYLGINLPDDIRTNLSGTNKTLAALVTIAHDVTVAQIATNEAFAMGSDVVDAKFEVWDGEDTAPAANVVKIDVKRFAAKFTVQEKSGLTLTGVNGGTLSELKFAIGQMNNSMFAAQKKVGDKVEDPNYTVSVGTGLDQGLPADYIAVNGSTVAEINDLAARYAPENTNENFISGNLTYISVSAKFAPEKVLTVVDGKLEEGNLADGDDFWCIRETDKVVYFKSEDAAKAYADEHIISYDKILKYTGGICYYTVFVNKDKDYDVLRNDFYRVTIAEIVGLGDTKPGPTDPGKPVEVKTNINVEVTVAPWNLVVVDDVELLPQ